MDLSTLPPPVRAMLEQAVQSFQEDNEPEMRRTRELILASDPDSRHPIDAWVEHVLEPGGERFNRVRAMAWTDLYMTPVQRHAAETAGAYHDKHPAAGFPEIASHVMTHMISNWSGDDHYDDQQGCMVLTLIAFATVKYLMGVGELYITGGPEDCGDPDCKGHGPERAMAPSQDPPQAMPTAGGRIGPMTVFQPSQIREVSDRANEGTGFYL